MLTKIKNGWTASIHLEDTIPPSGNTIVRVYDSNDRLIDVITGNYSDVMAVLRRCHCIPKGRTIIRKEA